MVTEFFAVLAGANNAFVPAPGGFKLDTNTNIIIDANSYYAKWVYDPINEIGDLKKLISEKGITSVTNVAIPGQTWANMRMNHGDVVSAYRPGMKNVLICGETRNWVAKDTAATAEKAVKQATDYVQAVTASIRAKYFPGDNTRKVFDKIIICGTIPNSTFLDEPWKNNIPGLNAVLIKSDQLMKESYKALGFDAFADFRANTVFFGGDGTTKPGFAQNQETVLEEIEKGDWVHPTGAAREAFAAAIADALKRLEV